MKPIFFLAAIIAGLVAIWTYISIGIPELHLIPWIAFVAWAAYFAGGGTALAAKNSLSAGIVAIFLAAVTLYLINIMGGGLYIMMVLFPIMAFLLVIMARVGGLTYTPAAFLGAASFFGNGGMVDITILYVISSWIAGIGLGIATIAINRLLNKYEKVEQ